MIDADTVELVLLAHTPEAVWCNDGTAELQCSCSYQATSWPDGTPKYAQVDWTIEHFVAELAKAVAEA